MLVDSPSNRDSPSNNLRRRRRAPPTHSRPRRDSFLNNPSLQSPQGDVDGHLHVLILPKNLIRAGAKEYDVMLGNLERDEQSVIYFEQRRAKLAEIKEELEKLAETDTGEEDPEKLAAEAEDKRVKALEAAEAAYKKYELEMKAQLAEEEAAVKDKKPARTQSAVKK